MACYAFAYFGVLVFILVDIGHEKNAGDKVRVLLCMGLQEGVAIPTTRSVLSFGGDVSPVFELKSVIGFCHCLV